MRYGVALAIVCISLGTLLTAEVQAQNAAKGRVRLVDVKCPDVIIPVCGTKDGSRVTYNNECEAKRAGATDIKPGRCDETK